MNQVIENGRDQLLEDWTARLEAARLLPGRRDENAIQLATWVAHLSSAASGDEWATRELFKLVAFYSRALGADGRPASEALARSLYLELAVRTLVKDVPAPLAKVLLDLHRVVVNAHATGQIERIKNLHQREIRDFSPVFRLGDDMVVAFLLGPMEADLIDAITGRLLRECAIRRAKIAVLDTFGAAPDNDMFHRTIKGFVASEAGLRLRLVLTGLRDPLAARRAIEALGADMDRLDFEEDLSSFLAKDFTE